MNIAIRVDASSQIGTGHFMRCLTLADALQQRGAQILFISRYLPGYLQDMLAAKKHDWLLLDNEATHDSVAESDAVADLAHASWLGVSQVQDAANSIQALAGQYWDWLIVDHYALDVRWETALRQTAKQILVIDDIADRQHDCDVLLDQNYYTDMNTRYTGNVPMHCRLLLGPRYALLREDFQTLHIQVKPRQGVVQRVLIFFGGMDVDNYTGRAIQALIDIGAQGFHVDIVIGALHPAREAIEAHCLSHNFICHVQTNRMAELMAAADLSIGAGGGATWERCCLGLPTITISVADNQRDQIADAALAGLVYCPDVTSTVDLLLKHHLKALIENSCLRQLISRNGMQKVDGRGTLRVIGNMQCHSVEVRKARQEDSEHLFSWRNHPTTRAVSRNTHLINWKDHQHWFASVLSAPNRLLLIGQRDGESLGVVRFDIQNDQAEVSIYLVPEIKKPGSGSDLLQSAETWLAQNYPQINLLLANVLGANMPSHRLFLAAGYEVESTAYLKRLH